MPKINKPFVPQQPGAGTDNYIDGGPTRAGLEELRNKVNTAPTTWATVAEAEAASYTEPESVVITETGRTYTYSANSEATRDGIRVLTPAGGGRLLAVKGLVSTDGVHLKGDGSVNDPIEHSQDTTDLFRFFVGAIISGYSAECLITSNGSTVTASVQSVGGGDIKYVTTDGYATLDCTPAATVVLSVGTDTAPVANWIYIDITDGILKKSTTGFPSSPYVPIDKRLIPSASFVQNYGTYPGNNFSDHVYSAGDNGHLTHLNQNFRLRPPVYISGALATISGSGTANCTVAVASGEILMNHQRTTYSFADGSNLLVANDQTTPYQIISNLYNLTTDTTGATLTGRWAAHFIWYGHAQESSGAKLFINKPSGTYLSADEARSDINGYFNSAVPPAFRGCAIGLRRVVARRSATGTIEINYKTSDDWRGKPLSSVAGSGGTTSFSSIFPTSDFRLEDTTDASKEIAFSASAIGTGQTRTITMPDNNVDLGPASRIASPSQSGLMSDTQATAVSLIRGSGTTTQRNALTGLAAGQQWYNTDISVLETYSGSYWLSPGRILLKNRTTGNSETGRSVQISTSYDFSVTYPNSASNDIDVIGVIETGGIAVGDDIIVNVGRGNVVNVLMETNDTTVSGDYVFARAGGLNYSSVTQANGAFAIALETKNNASAAYLVKCLLISTELK